MHLLMQYLDLSGPEPEQQVQALLARHLLTPEQAASLELEQVRRFLGLAPGGAHPPGGGGVPGVPVLPAAASVAV